ncbi:MAG TPA: amino acid adenylation domain-containing protein, partial [Longimicrobiaceae bacterium]
GTTGALRRVARQESATPFMALLAAWQTLLGRYAGQEDVVVGTPIAGRTRSEVEGLIGFFTNNLVHRADLSGAPGFRGLLGRVREGVLGAFAHQELPFERLVEELAPERSLGYTPLFQVLFSLQPSDTAGSRLGAAATEPLERGSEVAKFDLALYLEEAGERYAGALVYRTELFEAATIERMTGHFVALVDALAADPDRPLPEVEMLGAAERRQLLEGWNRTEADFPREQCLHELFEAQAGRTPGAVAVVFEEEALSYAELNARANRLAHALRRRGVGPEVRVGVCLERSLEMVVALLGVLKAGGAYVPLDPAYPAERLAYMLADSGVRVLLTGAAVRGALAVPEGVEVVDVAGAEAELAGEAEESPDSGVAPANLAYVIYTSGSTGRPKGVMNAHRGIVNRLAWMQAEYGLGADDVVLQKTPFSFDVSVWEFFWPLQQGARLVMARPQGHLDPAYLREEIERRGVTTLHFVPSMLQAFVETAGAERCASLRRVICSGEALGAALAERFHERFAPPVALHNLYGPTEAAVDVSYWACEREWAGAGVPIGRPVWNTQLYVLDRALGPVPVGVAGELYIGGVQVARGYLGR